MTKEDHEIRKLRAETKLINEQVLTERRSRNKGFVQSIKSFLPLIVTFITIAAGLLTFWSSFVKFIEYKREEEIRKARESNFQYNDKMVGLVSGLDHDSTTDRSVMLLKYFGRDAIPILLFKLERTGTNKNDKVIQSLVEIYENNIKEDTILHKILFDAVQTFEVECVKANPDDRNLDALDNYLILFKKLEIRKSNHLMALHGSLKQIKTQLDIINDAATKGPLIASYDSLIAYYKFTGS